MDDENNNDLQQRPDDLQLTQEKSAALLGKAREKVQNGTQTAGKVAGAGGKIVNKVVGPKLDNLKPVAKLKAVKREVEQGKKKIKKGTSKIHKGRVAVSRGHALRSAGKKIRGAATAAATIPYVGPALSKALKATGKKIEKKGKKTIKHGEKLYNKGSDQLKKGINQIRRAPFAKPGKNSSSGDDDDGDSKIPLPEVPNAKRVIKDTIKKALKRIGLMLKTFFIKYWWVFVIPLIVLIVLVLLMKDSEVRSAKYDEGNFANVPYVIDSQILDNLTIVSDGKDGYKYAFKDEEGNIISIDEATENALKTLKENKSTDLEFLGFTTGQRKRTLKKLIEAEIATQYPDISYSATMSGDTITTTPDNSNQSTLSNVMSSVRDALDSEEKVQGNIKIQRKDEDGNVERLAYVDEATFNSLISSKSDEVFKYYTLKKATGSGSHSFSGGTNILSDFIASWENGNLLKFKYGVGSYTDYLVQGYITEDGKEYICRTDEGTGNGTKNFGFGIMVNQNGRPNNVEYFARYGIDITDPQYLQERVSTLPVELVDQVKADILEDKVKNVEAVAANHGVVLSTEQVHALVGVAYQYGDYGARLDNFMELYKQYGNTDALRSHYSMFVSVPGGTNPEGMSRADASWALFHNGEYHAGVAIELNPSNYQGNNNTSRATTTGNTTSTTSSTTTLSSETSNGVTLTSGGNLDFLDCAVRAHKLANDEGFYYNNSGRDVPIKSGDSNKGIDCAVFVSTALDWYGYNDWQYYPHQLTDTTVITYGDQKLEKVFEGSAMNVSEIPDLQSGDIITMPGHTQIFYGYNASGEAVWLNCGGNDAIQRIEGTDAYSSLWKPITHVYRVPGGGGTRAVVTSLDNFLFIGDSRYSTVASQISSLGNNINNVGVGSSRIDEWLKVANNNGKGKVQSTNVDITGTYSGISIQLGANSVYDNVDKSVAEMKELLEKLKELHPGTPIFVNSCLSVNSNATKAGYTWDVTKMKDYIKQYDKAISDYCNQNSGLYFVDISEGLEDENGFVKAEYEDDGLHCNSTSASIFAQNVKEAILKVGERTSRDGQGNANANSKYVLVVATKTDTTVSIDDSYTYAYSYAVDKNSGAIHNGYSQAYGSMESNTHVSTTTTTSFGSTTADYQEAMRQYTLYFDFLWALLVNSSGDRDFVSEWADLSLNSEATITVYNNKTKSSSVSTVDKGTYTHTQLDEGSSLAVYDLYNVKETTTTTTDKIESKMAITYADTWLIKYENDADTYQEFQSTSKEVVTEKTSPDYKEANPIKILQKKKGRLKDLTNDEYIIDESIEDNTKIDYMVDIYSYLLQVANKVDPSKMTLSLDELINTNVFDLSSTTGVTEKVLLYTSINITDEEKEELYRAVEAICEPYGNDEKRKKYVTSVILNRVLSSEFPDTVKEVIEQKGQFPNLKPKEIANGSGGYFDETKKAVDEVLAAGDCSDYSVYVNTPSGAEKLKWDKKFEFVMNDGDKSDNSLNYYTTAEVKRELKKLEVSKGVGATAPTEIARKIVEWAEKHVGQSSFYCSYQGRTLPARNWCYAFAETAYYEAGFDILYGNPADMPLYEKIKYNADGTVDYSNIPVGAVLISNGTNSAVGHATLYIGNGYVIEAGAATVQKSTIDQSFAGMNGNCGPYRGWGFPTQNQEDAFNKLTVKNTENKDKSEAESKSNKDE